MTKTADKQKVTIKKIVRNSPNFAVFVGSTHVDALIQVYGGNGDLVLHRKDPRIDEEGMQTINDFLSKHNQKLND